MTKSVTFSITKQSKDGFGHKIMPVYNLVIKQEEPQTEIVIPYNCLDSLSDFINKVKRWNTL